MNQITINILELKLFEYVKLIVQLFDNDRNHIDNRIYTIDTINGYNEWNNDDTFIIEWVKKRLNEEQLTESSLQEESK